MDFVVMPSKAKGKEEYINLYARVRHNKECKKYALGFCVKRKEWQKVKTFSYQGSAIMTSVSMKYIQFVSILTKIKYSIEKQPDSKMIPVLIKSIKSEVLTGNSLFTPEAITKDTILLDDYMQQYINDLKDGKKLKIGSSRKVTEAYIKHLTTALTSIKLYEDVICSKITLDNVNMEFRNAYVNYLRKSSYKTNTIAARMSCVRTIARAAYMEKLTKCDAFMNPGFVPSGEEVNAVFLTPERLEQIRNMDLSSFESVKEAFDKAFPEKKPKIISDLKKKDVQNFIHVRDIFVVGCLVGQRFSDYRRISKDMIIKLKNKKFLKLRQEKTGKVIIIPFDIRVTEILDRYKDGKLPCIDMNTFNCILRILGEMLGWTEYPLFHSQEGQKQKLRFCDMMASHTARRTFATNAYVADIPLKSIMAVTGHSSEKTLRRYLKLQVEDKAVLAADDFKGFIQED